MNALKLMALDAEDLAILSAHVQDAVLKVGDLAYLPRAGQFSVVMNRFAWETADRRTKGFERRRAVLTFKRVAAVRSAHIDRERRDDVLSLLALHFSQNGDGPDGTVELVLAAGATLALDVECIEAQLADTGGAWQTASLPSHPDN